jgi:hypothetical protein
MAPLSFKRHHIWWGLTGVAGAACIGVAALFVYVWFFFETFGACRNVELSSILSPDGKKSVVSFRKQCGATVADSSHATLVPAGEPFSAEKYAPFLSLAGTTDILVAWRGNRVVEIALIPGGAADLKRDPQVGDVHIDYK